jgi:CheY-like chemotaxis protein
MPDHVVICVDDEPILLLALRQQLRSKLGPGWRCETATSAESALALIDELRAEGHSISAVVSDWLMPGMKGDEFLRKVNAGALAERLILLTGYAERDQVAALEADVPLAATFEKPCDARALAAAIVRN